MLENAPLLLVHGGPVRHGFSSVEGDRGSLELDPLECGGSGWLKSISSAEKHIIIETACASELTPQSNVIILSVLIQME